MLLYTQGRGLHPGHRYAGQSSRRQTLPEGTRKSVRMSAMSDPQWCKFNWIFSRKVASRRMTESWPAFCGARDLPAFFILGRISTWRKRNIQTIRSYRDVPIVAQWRSWEAQLSAFDDRRHVRPISKLKLIVHIVCIIFAVFHWAFWTSSTFSN